MSDYSIPPANAPQASPANAPQTPPADRSWSSPPRALTPGWDRQERVTGRLFGLHRWQVLGVPVINLVLFLLTFGTTTMAGALHAGVNPFADPANLSKGFSFSVPLMTILLCHELGHYVLAAYHGVDATLPFFIPGPPWLVGTFGAFIRMRGMPRSRRALFDIGAAGPWAGLMVAIPAVMLGLHWSEIRPLTSGVDGGLTLGDSVLFTSLARLMLGVDPDQVTIILHPVALAGWFGIFVTFLNLLPVGQLDGGHVVYALLGRGHRMVARLFLLVVFGMGFLGWQGWFLWAFMLAFVLRVDHPPTLDSETPLDPRRKLAAWLTIGIFSLTFMPVPLSVVEPQVELPREPLERAPFERREPPSPPQHPRGFEENEPADDESGDLEFLTVEWSVKPGLENGTVIRT